MTTAPPRPTVEAVRDLIRDEATRAGGVRFLAWAWGLSKHAIYNSLSPRNRVARCVLDRLGLDPATIDYGPPPGVDGPPALTPLQAKLLAYAKALPDGRTASYGEAGRALGEFRQTVRTAANRLLALGHDDAARIGAGSVGRPHEPRSEFDLEDDPPQHVTDALLARRDEVRARSERRHWQRRCGVVEMPTKVYRHPLMRV